MTNDIVWIKSQRSNVLDHIIINDNIGELYFNNGDYLKYSKLQRGQVYDCRMNLPTGLCIIKLDNAKPVTSFKCTQERYYKDITVEIEKKYYYDDLLIDFINLDGNEDLERAVDAYYNQLAKKEGESYAIIETVSTDSIEAAKKADTRTYKISGYFRDWASTVKVDVKTKKVISVTNRTY